MPNGASRASQNLLHHVLTPDPFPSPRFQVKVTSTGDAPKDSRSFRPNTIAEINAAMNYQPLTMQVRYQVSSEIRRRG